MLFVFFVTPWVAEGKPIFFYSTFELKTEWNFYSLLLSFFLCILNVDVKIIGTHTNDSGVRYQACDSEDLNTGLIPSLHNLCLNSKIYNNLVDYLMHEILKSKLYFHRLVFIIYYFKVKPRLIGSLMLGLITIWSCSKNILILDHISEERLNLLNFMKPQQHLTNSHYQTHS